MGFITNPSQISFPELILWDSENNLLKSTLGCGHYYTLDELYLLRSYIDMAVKSIHENCFNIELENEVAYNNAMAAQQMRTPKIVKAKKESVVYLAYDSNAMAYKIGTTVNIKSRAKSLKTANPYLEITHTCSGSYNLEAKLHVMFKNDKIRGEWFELNNWQINQIITNFGFKDYKDK